MSLCAGDLEGTVTKTNIRQDSIYFAEKMTAMNRFHIKILRLRIYALGDEVIASAEMSDPPSDSC
jgi:hypothetical protein